MKKVLVSVFVISLGFGMVACSPQTTETEEVNSATEEANSAVEASEPQEASIPEDAKREGILREGYTPLNMKANGLTAEDFIPEPVTDFSEISEKERIYRDGSTWQEMKRMARDVETALIRNRPEDGTEIDFRPILFEAASQDAAAVTGTYWSFEANAEGNYIIRGWHPDGRKYVSEETAMIYSPDEGGIINYFIDYTDSE